MPKIESQPRNVGIEYREASIDTRAIDQEARTIELSFSSEHPVERFFGTEILDHGPDSVRLGRFQDGAAVLVDHDRKDHVGVVESVSISGRVGRATIRLGRSDRATEIFQDVVDGIRKSVSVGYRIYRAVLEEVDGDDERFRIMDWEPMELSLVSIGADPTVGVGRDADTENQCVFEREAKMSTGDIELNPTSAGRREPAPVTAPSVDVKEVAEDARKSELKRIRTLTSLGDKFKLEADAQRWIDEGKDVDSFRDFVLDRLETAPKDPPAKLDMDRKEVKRYSFFNMIRGLAFGNLEKHAPFELDCSEQVARKLDRDPQGVFVPWDILMDPGYARHDLMPMGYRAPPMDTGDNVHLVGTDHMGSQFIELLRTNTVVIQAGARMLTGLVGNLSIPKQADKATFYWVPEDGAATDSEVPTATVPMSPTTLAGAVPITRRLLLQSDPSAEAIVREDLVTGAGEAIDLAALEGSGAANQPRGIVNQTGVLTQAIADVGNVPTWAETVGFETQLGEANSLRGSVSWVMTPTQVGNTKTTTKDGGSGRFIMEDNAVNGYVVRTSTQITADRMILGNFRDLLIGMWGVMDVINDTATKAPEGGLVIRVFQDLDVAVRHAQSFCINA